MAPTLYLSDYSQPSLATLVTVKTLNIPVEIKYINLQKGEQLSPEYKKINPQHTVPTLDDDGFVIWDSHAICAYLVSKYGKDDSLYPKDLQQRAIVDQRLHFDSGVLFAKLRGVFFPIVYLHQKEIPQERVNDILEAYGLMDEIFKGHKYDWFALDRPTIADFSALASILSLNIFVPIDYKKYTGIAAWLNKCEAMPFYNIIKEGAVKFEAIVKKARC